MNPPLKLMAVFAHPDDESMGLGATLAKYAAEGISTHLVCATRGEKGWFGPEEAYPGAQALGVTRTQELLAAARELDLKSVDFLNAIDGELAQADSARMITQLVSLLREVRPHVVVTFGPDGDYGHPDHIAICQLTAAALVCGADPAFGAHGTAHRVDKFYFMVSSPQLAELVHAQFGDDIGIEVDGVRRSIVTWPEWAITTRLDLTPYWETMHCAILCHRSQLPSLGDVDQITDETWRNIATAANAFFRQYSLVALPPGLETDLFAGLR